MIHIPRWRCHSKRLVPMSVYYIVLVFLVVLMALVPYNNGQPYTENDDLEVVRSCQTGYDETDCGQNGFDNIIIAATLNGAVTALNGDSGELLWRHEDVPLLQGTLSNAGPIDIGGTSLQLMPTLDGRLFSYAQQINLIEPLPITTDSLLESTIRLGQDAVAGGKTVTTKGFDLYTGEKKYECTVESCGNGANELPENPILLVKRITNSIRAMDTLRGVERWNLSTAELDISLAGGFSMGEVQGGNRKILLQPPDGVVVSTKYNREQWKTDVGGHIVSVWQVSGNRIEEISIFNPSNIYTTQFEVMHREERNMQTQSSLLYMGTSDGYPFIIQSPKAKQNLKRKMNALPDQSQLGELTNPQFCSASGGGSELAYQVEATALQTVLENAFRQSHSKAIEDKTSKAARGKLQIVSPNEDPAAQKIGTENLRSTSLSKGGDYGYLVLESDTRKTKFKVPSPITFMNTLASYVPATIASVVSAAVGLVGVVVAVVYNQMKKNNRRMIVGGSKRESTESEGSSMTRTLTTSFAPADDELERFAEGSDVSVSPLGSPVTAPSRAVTLPAEKSAVDFRTSPSVKPQKRLVKTDIDTDEASFEDEEQKRLRRHRTISRSSLEGFTSRFANEFEVKKVIGHGGFGVVFRAQSITDMNEYAVKRIAVADNEKARNRVLREARALAMFDHPGIIRYFYAWEERPPKGFQEKEDETLLGKMKAEKLAKLHEIRRGKKESSKAHNVKSAETASFAVSFEMPPVVGNTVEESSWSASAAPNGVTMKRTTSESKKSLGGFSESGASVKSAGFSDESSSSEDESDTSETTASSSSNIDVSSKEVASSTGGIVFGDSDNKENISDGVHDEEKIAKMELKEIDRQISIHNKAMIVETENHELEVRDIGDCAYLYIVMQLCAERTLQHWIKKNKTLESRTPTMMKDWIKQLASGLDYLHNKGFIHRDLKPGNVFFSLDSNQEHSILKIGDLGLATKTDGAPKITMRQDSDSDAKHTKNVGTRSYMSPEQLGHQQYTEKVDVFALGLVATELIIPFSTASERVYTFTDYQRGETPSILDNYPESRDFLMQLTNIDPAQRPTAKEVVSHPYLK